MLVNTGLLGPTAAVVPIARKRNVQNVFLNYVSTKFQKFDEIWM